MGSGFFDPSLFGDQDAQESNNERRETLLVERGNPATMYIVVADPLTKQPATTGLSVVFTLWRDGTVVVNKRPMIVQPPSPTSTVPLFTCTVLGTELSQHGQYQWEVVATSTSILTNGDPVVTTARGSFSL